MGHIAIQLFKRQPANLREQVQLVHHAAAKHDLLGRKGDDGGNTHLRQVFRLHVPGDVIDGQRFGGHPPPLFNGRTAGHALQAAIVVGAKALGRGIAGIRSKQHMAHLGVHQPVQQLAFDVSAAAHTGADGVVDQAV